MESTTTSSNSSVWNHIHFGTYPFLIDPKYNIYWFWFTAFNKNWNTDIMTNQNLPRVQYQRQFPWDPAKECHFTKTYIQKKKNAT